MPGETAAPDAEDRHRDQLAGPSVARCRIRSRDRSNGVPNACDQPVNISTRIRRVDQPHTASVDKLSELYRLPLRAAETRPGPQCRQAESSGNPLLLRVLPAQDATPTSHSACHRTGPADRPHASEADRPAPRTRARCRPSAYDLSSVRRRNVSTLQVDITLRAAPSWPAPRGALRAGRPGHVDSAGSARSLLTRRGPAKAQCRFGADRPLTVKDLVDAARRHPDCLASRYWLMPSGSRNSSNSTSPGLIGACTALIALCYKADGIHHPTERGGLAVAIIQAWPTIGTG